MKQTFGEYKPTMQHAVCNGWGAILQAERSRVWNPMKWMFFFSTYLILLAALGTGVHSASNRNKYQKEKNNVSEE
jgi:hypothetical protein